MFLRSASGRISATASAAIAARSVPRSSIASCPDWIRDRNSRSPTRRSSRCALRSITVSEMVRVQPLGPLVPQQRDVADDRGQRGAQLMRDQADELVLQPVQLAQLLVLRAQLGGLLGQCVLGPDLRGHVAGYAERADDLAVRVQQRHLGSGHPGVRPAAVGLPFHQPGDRLTGADDPLFVGERRGRVLAAEHVEVGLAHQLVGAAARRVRGDPALADEQEPAHQVLEIDPLLRRGQQIAHADELEVAQFLRLRPVRRLQAHRGHRTPRSSRG